MPPPSRRCPRIIATRSTGCLVAQAQVEGVTLLTSDAALGAYAGAVRVV